MAREDLETIADELHRDIEIEPPISAIMLAEASGLTVSTPNKRDARVRGVILVVDMTLGALEVEAQAALHYAQWRLRRERARADDESVDYLARALLLPRESFRRDLRKTRNVKSLQRIHTYACERFIERRILDLSSEVAELRLVSRR